MKFFACSDCGYRVNSDHNASVNLHRVYATPSWGQSFCEFRNLKANQQRERRCELDFQLQSTLASMHDPADFNELPFRTYDVDAQRTQGPQRSLSSCSSYAFGVGIYCFIESSTKLLGGSLIHLVMTNQFTCPTLM